MQEDRFERRERIKQRNKRRRRRIISAIMSFIFVFSVFFVVVKAGVENFYISRENGNSSFKNEISVENSIEISGRNRKSNYYTVLVAVTDEDDIRTDSLIVACFDKENSEINLLNIPRDTYSNATTQNKKITSAYVNKIEHTLDVVADTVGFRPDNYVVLNLQGLEKIIDITGGVLVDVPFNMRYDDPDQDLHINIKQGSQVLDGKNSVHYLRWRKNNDGKTMYPDGDLGRIRATQEFISLVKDQFFSFSTIFKIPQITNTVFNNIDTDLKFNDIVWLATNTLNIDDINSYTLPGESEYYKGISYYMPNEQEILTLVNECFNPYTNEIKSLNLLEK